MKNIITLILLLLIVPPIMSQHLEHLSNDMETIEYGLPLLIIKDSSLLSDIDYLVLHPAKSSVNCNKTKYFRIYFEQEHGNITVCIEQSKYPVKQKNSFGYFDHNDMTFIISGLKISSLFEVGREMRTFTYKDYIQPTIFMIEDDIPCWFFIYKDGKLNLKDSNNETNQAL